jgi:hypothetical protein
VEDHSPTKKASCHAQPEEKIVMRVGNYDILQNTVCQKHNKSYQRQKSRQEVNEVTQTRQDYLDDTDEEFAYVINSNTKPPETRITVENVAIKAIVDIGSSVNRFSKK